MLKILRGPWVASLSTGVVLMLIGIGAQHWLEAPALWLAAVIVVAFIGAFVAGYSIDKLGNASMAVQDPVPLPSVGISIANGKDNIVTVGKIIGFDHAVIVENEENLSATVSEIIHPTSDGR